MVCRWNGMQWNGWVDVLLASCLLFLVASDGLTMEGMHA